MFLIFRIFRIFRILRICRIVRMRLSKYHGCPCFTYKTSAPCVCQSLFYMFESLRLPRLSWGYLCQRAKHWNPVLRLPRLPWGYLCQRANHWNPALRLPRLPWGYLCQRVNQWNPCYIEATFANEINFRSNFICFSSFETQFMLVIFFYTLFANSSLWTTFEIC